MRVKSLSPIDIELTTTTEVAIQQVVNGLMAMNFTAKQAITELKSLISMQPVAPAMRFLETMSDDLFIAFLEGDRERMAEILAAMPQPAGCASRFDGLACEHPDPNHVGLHEASSPHNIMIRVFWYGGRNLPAKGVYHRGASNCPDCSSRIRNYPIDGCENDWHLC